jgi:lysyl-tRNA synthetase class 2
LSEQNELIKRRLEELEEIKSKGINPYPHRYDVTTDSKSVIDSFKDPESDEEKEKNKEVLVSVAGRIMAIRKMGKATFFLIKDETGKSRSISKKMKLVKRHMTYLNCWTLVT